ncbi:MAG: PAS domain S-box protein [Deltaproteobacteria bacterium]|nr:PAS domain S-box protein [Deltaproteobacteria bacterium]
MPEKPTYEELEQKVRDLERTEASLRESEEKYRFLAENVTNVIWTMDMEMRLTYLSRSVGLLLGFTPEEAMARTLRELMTLDSYERCIKVYDEELAEHNKGTRTKEPVQVKVELVGKGGVTVMTEVQANFVYSADDEPTGIIGVVRDITEINRALMELKESQIILRTVVDATPNGVFVKDQDGRYLLANNALASLYHASPDELVGRTDMELAQLGKLSEDEARSFIADDQEVMQTKRSKIITDEPLTRKDGTTCWFYTVKAPLSLPDKENCILGVAIDITKLKEAEKAIKDAEIEKTTILDHQPDHAVLQDVGGRILWANLAACQSVAMQREELTGKFCYEIWQRRQDACPDCPVRKSLATGKLETVVKTTPDGKIWRIQGIPILNEKGEIIRALEPSEDITEKTRQEELLKQSEEKYRDLVERINDVIFSVDLDGRISYMSPSGGRSWDMSRNI